MLYQRLSSLLALTLVLAGAGCSSSTGGTSTTPGPEGSAKTEREMPAGIRRGAVSYGPVSSVRYRLESHDSLAMEMPDGSFQRTIMVKTAFLTVSMRESGDDLQADISLDSLVLDRADPRVQPLVDSTRGTQWQGIVHRNGRIDSLVANRPSVFGEQVRTMLHRLFPVLPPDGADPGRTWQDSTTMPFQMMAGFSADENRVAEYRAGKWEELRGTRVLVVQSATRYTVTGSGSGFGQEIKLEGSGTAVGTHRISTSGQLLQAQVADSVNMTLTVPAVGQTVPTVVVATYSISVVP